MGAEARPDGLAAAVAEAAARDGSRVEVVARLGDDPAGDAVLLAFARDGVGHVAVLRDAARSTPVRSTAEPPSDLDADDVASEEADVIAETGPEPTLDRDDVSLALRYLVDFRVIVLVHPRDTDMVAEVASAASFAGAHLVAIADPAAAPPEGLPGDALVVTAADDAAGVGDVLGRYAAAVDRGEEPAAAFAATAPLESVEP